MTATAIQGVFEFEDDREDETFNLRPRDKREGAIPEDQRKVSQQVYEATNILKLLKSENVFKPGEEAYKEFWSRVMQAGHVGCVDPNVDTGLALSALEQIRADILRRKGRNVAYRYLVILAAWALGGVVLGAGIGFFLRVPGYGPVVIGAMIGAWLSAAASRREISFDTIQEYVDVHYEPGIRLLFVLLVAGTFALLLQLNIISVIVGTTNLATFVRDDWLALALGIFAGICEKAISVQIVDRAQKILSP